MSTNIVLGIKVEVGPVKRVNISNLNLEHEVKSLREEASKQSNKPPENLEFIYQGRVLDDHKKFKDYGVKSGDMIYVFNVEEAEEKNENDTQSTLTADAINMLFKSYSIPTRSVTSFVNTMDTIFETASIDKFLEIEPDLAKDPIALSYLTVPELVYHLQDPETFENFSKKHPILIPAFVKILKALVQTAARGQLASIALQHMESDEEEEDVDVENVEDDGSENDGETQRSGGGSVTVQQLSVALAMAEALASGRAAPSSANRESELRDMLERFTGDGASSSASPSRPIITPDMFSNALSQAMSSVSGTSSAGETSSASTAGITPAVPSSESSTSDNPSGRNYTSQLLRMQELGMFNHRLNLRALIISGGDVNAAINLVFSGAIED